MLSSVRAASTQKPVAKAQEGEWATELGGKVHTDLWGPAPVICLGCNKDLWSRRSKYKSYGALRGCDLGVRDCLQMYCGK